MSKFYNIKSPTEILFNNEVELLPSVTELFEYELAYLEYKSLSETEYVGKTAYGKSFRNKPSLHYLTYSEILESISKTRSVSTNSYFKSGLFSTGYATHSLFPYRGKFHPQLIKGIINIIGIKKGDIIIDPMAGSGTTNIEASLMGINSYAIDISPFCQIMIETKYKALSINIDLLEKADLSSSKWFKFFNKNNILQELNTKDEEKRKVYYLAFLAYLDALGYSKRVVRSNHEQLFNKVINRYIETVKGLLKNVHYKESTLGEVEILKKSDALKIELPKESVDGIITSPPYSFAINYVENDKDQLEYLGYDTKQLKNQLIGLKGKNKKEKLEIYFNDMDTFCKEASRILKKNKYFVMIIGSNTNQTGGIRLEETIINSASKYGMTLVKSILKPIKGMRNTMKEEYILMFEKE